MSPENITEAMGEFSAALAEAFANSSVKPTSHGAMVGFEEHAKTAAVEAFITWLAIRQLRTLTPTTDRKGN